MIKPGREAEGRRGERTYACRDDGKMRVGGRAQEEKNGCEWMEMRRDKRIRGRGRNGSGWQWKSEIML